VNELLEILARGALLGAAGAALMDVWAWLVRRTTGVRGLDYALLGRWIGHIPRGRLTHERIADATPIAGERPLGWLSHYAIGVAFAVVLLGIWGLDWAHAPTIGPALVVALGTIAAPWFVMQPAMGAGLAGSRTPDPGATRLRNLAMHAVYGVGLYLAAIALSVAWVSPPAT
jgi:hypothetical protein